MSSFKRKYAHFEQVRQPRPLKDSQGYLRPFISSLSLDLNNAHTLEFPG